MFTIRFTTNFSTSGIIHIQQLHTNQFLSAVTWVVKMSMCIQLKTLYKSCKLCILFFYFNFKSTKLAYITLFSEKCNVTLLDKTYQGFVRLNLQWKWVNPKTRSNERVCNLVPAQNFRSIFWHEILSLFLVLEENKYFWSASDFKQILNIAFYTTI